jgi:hypothetical protein
MTDEFAALFDGIDAPRPLPTQLRRGIESRLMQGAVRDELVAAEAPRQLPSEMRERLESALLAGVDDRPLPIPLRRRLQRTLIRDPQRRARAVVLVAAAFFVLSGAVALLGSDDPPDAVSSAAGRTRGGSLSAGGSDVASGDSLDASAASGSTAAGTAGGNVVSGGASSARSAARSAAVEVRIIGGDADDEAGFRAYAAGHGVRITSAATAAVTVNLSSQPIEPPRSTVLLEALSVRESALRDDVFAAASVVERQAHIAADAAFPQDASGKRAVIFTGGPEPFRSRVPAAIESVLRDRGVSVLRVGFDDAVPAVLPRADAAFLSLPTEMAGEWLRDAEDRSYAPARGTWGVYSLADDALVAHMSPSVRVVSPFAFSDNADAAELRRTLGRPLSARAIHGWVTAKLLTEAIARTDDTTAPGISAALAVLGGYDDGFGAPYDLRADTHSRTPEGIVLRPSGGRLVADGAFMRDKR